MTTIKVKRFDGGFSAKVFLAPGLVVTIRGVARRSDAQLVAAAWEMVEEAQS